MPCRLVIPRPPVYGFHRLPVAGVCSRLGDESDSGCRNPSISISLWLIQSLAPPTRNRLLPPWFLVRGKWPLLRFISSSATATYPIKSSLSRHVCSAARPTWLRRSVRASSPAMLCTWPGWVTPSWSGPGRKMSAVMCLRLDIQLLFIFSFPSFCSSSFSVAHLLFVLAVALCINLTIV